MIKVFLPWFLMITMGEIEGICRINVFILRDWETLDTGKRIRL